MKIWNEGDRKTEECSLFYVESGGDNPYENMKEKEAETKYSLW